MKYILAVAFCFVFTIGTSSAQFFVEKLAYPTGVVSTESCVTSDQQILVTGSIGTNGGTPSGILLMKSDLNGSVSWVKKYSSPGASFNNGFNVTETYDHNYLFAGLSYFSSPFTRLISLVKTDTSGNMIWQKSFGSASLKKMAVAPDNNVYVLFNVGTPAGSFTVAKFDSNGDSLWANTFYSPNIVSDGGVDMVIAPSNEILVTSNMFCNAGCQHAMWTKIDTSGNQIRTQEVDLLASPYIAAGSNSYFVLLPGSCIIRTDTSGVTLWSKQLGFCRVVDLKADSVGGLYISGDYNDGNHERAFLAHSDSSGTVDVFKLYEADLQNTFTELTLSENVIVLTGYTGPQINSENILFTVEDFTGNCGLDTIVTFDTSSAYQINPFTLLQAPYSVSFYSGAITVSSDTLITTSTCRPSNSISLVSVSERNHLIYPNPANDKVVVEAERNSDVRIYDQSGRCVSVFKKYNEEEIDVSQFLPGIYTVVIRSEKISAVEKLIIISKN